MLHPRIAAVRADGTLVGDGLREIDTRILETVDAGKDLCPNHATERLVAGIRAAVVDVPRSDPCDNSVPIEGHARVAKRALVPVGAGNVVLRACFDPFHGPSAGLFRCQRARGHLRIGSDFDAEAAADVESLYADAIDGNAEMRREELNGERGKLIVAPIIDVLVFRIPVRDNGVIFEWRAREPVEMQMVDAEDVGGFAKGFLHIAIFKDTAPYAIRACVFVEQNFVFESAFGIDHRVEAFVLN